MSTKLVALKVAIPSVEPLAAALLIVIVEPEPVELDRVKRPVKLSSEETPPAAPPVQSSKDNVPLPLV